MGKGSKRRPEDTKKMDENWARAFSTPREPITDAMWDLLYGEDLAMVQAMRRVPPPSWPSNV